MMMVKIVTITKAVFMFRTWRQNLPTNDFTCSPDFIWAHTVRWYKYKSPALQMTIQSYTNSIGSMGWDIFTLFTFETWLFDEQSSFDVIVLLLRISCIDEELNCWKRISLQKQRHIVDIWWMRWTAPILFQFLFPQLFASDSRGDVTEAILSRRLFRTFLLRMEFLDSGLPPHHQHLCKNWDVMMACVCPTAVCDAPGGCARTPNHVNET